MDEYMTVYDEYQKGVEYKRRIRLYDSVNENYRYFQGDQWHGVKSNGLPCPVFNFIKPIINYKVSNVMATQTKIVYKCGNTLSENVKELSDVADKLTAYAAQLYEKLKIDYKSEQILKESAITGNGFLYFYYDPATKEVKAEAVDSTNVYPANPNNDDIQSQDSLIIAFRRNVENVKAEAKANGIDTTDLGNIVSDTETNELAGDKAKIEIDDNGMCMVLLKLWRSKETGTIWFKKVVGQFEIVKDTDLGLQYYPISMMIWEKQKNSLFGVSDVEMLIPNQDYVNTIAAMIMTATTYYAFPKMVYDGDLMKTPPSNEIGESIAVTTGGMQSIKNVLDFITPGQISGDAFNMLSFTVNTTKEMAGANDGALGNINPEKASGRSILAVAEQSSVPLESIKRRFYNFLEDMAIIWSDMWRVYNANGKTISITNEDGTIDNYEITAEAFREMMLSVNIDVGASNRFSELAVMQTLDNLLSAKIIPFDWWIQLQPDSSGIPKAKLMELMQKQAQQHQQQPTVPNVDEMMSGLSPEQEQEFLQNPQKLKEFIAQNVGANQQQREMGMM